MTNTAYLYNAAELSLSSYSELEVGPTGNQRAALTSATGAAMSLAQATEFARRYPAIITQYADTLANGGMGTGLNVTVFADAGGKLTLAIRGTDSLAVGGDASDLATGLDIQFNGMAYDQIVALVNWWNRERAKGSGLES